MKNCPDDESVSLHNESAPDDGRAESVPDTPPITRIGLSAMIGAVAFATLLDWSFASAHHFSDTGSTWAPLVWITVVGVGAILGYVCARTVLTVATTIVSGWRYRHRGERVSPLQHDTRTPLNWADPDYLLLRLAFLPIALLGGYYLHFHGWPVLLAYATAILIYIADDVTNVVLTRVGTS